MRYKFTLNLVDPLRHTLPINYQFELGSWFFRVLNQEDSTFRVFLKSKGLVKGDQPFRDYLFSNLIIPQRTIRNDRLMVDGEQVELIFSTIPGDDMAETIHALFQNITFTIGDRISQVPFQLWKIEQQPEPDFSDKMTFKTLSPIHLSRKRPGSQQTEHLSPESPDYCLPFFEQLHRKYQILHGHEHPHDPASGKFKLRSEVIQKGITFNPGTRTQNKLIGYQLRFRLQADPDLLRAGYYLGFGEKNHLGFGCCAVL